MPRLCRTILAALALAAALAPVALAAAVKTRTVSFRCQGTNTSATTQNFKTDCASAVSPKPFDRFTEVMDSSRTPIVIYKFTLKGGTLTLTGETTLAGASVKAVWRVSSGTGVFKKASGSGTLTGELKKDAAFTFKGRIKY